MTGSSVNMSSSCLFLFSSLGKSGISGKPNNSIGLVIWEGQKVDRLKDPGELAHACSYSFLLQFIPQIIPSEMALKNKQMTANTIMRSLLKSQDPLLLVPDSH